MGRGRYVETHIDLNACIEKARKRKDLKLCPEGYCAAKQKFRVYPSAYANGYATKLCKNLKKKQKMPKKRSKGNLRRWYEEKWVNLCTPDLKPCGSSKKNQYAYCRPSKKLPGTGVITLSELKKALSAAEYRRLVEFMCKKKQQNPEIKLRLPSLVVDLVRKREPCYDIPPRVRERAEQALHLRSCFFQGGTETGWARAHQLAHDKAIPLSDVRAMRAWFARHVKTSYPGYKQWVEQGSPTDRPARTKHRGAVAWLLWGGTPAYHWIRGLLP
jgi:hypothetical protein